VTHSSTGRGGSSGDEPNDGLGLGPGLVVLLQELGSVLLHRTSDLTDDDDTLGSGVVEENAEGVDVGGSGLGLRCGVD
jgi:hypothetical protein